MCGLVLFQFLVFFAAKELTLVVYGVGFRDVYAAVGTGYDPAGQGGRGIQAVTVFAVGEIAPNLQQSEPNQGTEDGDVNEF